MNAPRTGYGAYAVHGTNRAARRRLRKFGPGGYGWRRGPVFRLCGGVYRWHALVQIGPMNGIFITDGLPSLWILGSVLGCRVGIGWPNDWSARRKSEGA